jgi:hypothetical protein
MNPLEAVALVAILFLPIHCLVQWQFSRLDDPSYLRSHGIVVVHECTLEGHTEPVGEYAGRAIWGSVTFMGMRYRFDRVARPQDKEKTGPGELYLDPGLVYVAV